MFCDKCGNQLPDNAKFCGNCGNVIAQPEQPPVQEPVYQPSVQEPVYQPPVQQPAYQQPVQQPAYQQPMSRGKFISSKGGPKGLAWGSCIILLLCAVLIGVCLYMTLWGDITEMPAISMFASLVDADIDELDEVFDEGAEMMEESRRQVEQMKDESMTADEEEAVELLEELVDEAEEAIEDRSFMGLRTALSTLLKVDRELDDLLDDYEPLDTMEYEEITMVFDILLGVFFGCFGLAILLAVLAAIFKNNVLTVFAALSSVGLCALWASPVVAVVLLVLFIVAIVLNSKITGAYKAYRRSLGLYN